MSHEKPSSETIRKVLGYVRDHGGLDSEDVWYCKEKYPFKPEEYNAVDNWMEDLAMEADVLREDCEDMFPQGFASFIWEGVKIVHHTMSGQGTVSMIVRDDYNPEYVPWDKQTPLTIEV